VGEQETLDAMPPPGPEEQVSVDYGVQIEENKPNSSQYFSDYVAIKPA
jgi:hypothetical protein